MITPEVAPIVKVGGLADVVGALPKYLEQLGHDVRVVCPLYGSVDRNLVGKVLPEPLNVFLGNRLMQAAVWESRLPDNDVKLYFLEHNDYYARPEVYDGPWGTHKDNDQRFAFLSRAGLNLCTYLDWIPDVIHCHDWTTGLVPVYLNTTDINGPLGKAASVFTIHNLLHQGYFDHSLLEFAQLPHTVFRPDNLESMGMVNMMKGGIYNATKITTVSPTYAREIQLPEMGCGLNHVLKYRAGDLIGVLNGADLEAWDPMTDPYIPAKFNAHDLSGKKICKQQLQESFGLAQEAGTMVFGLVSRLYDQKGLDLLNAVIPKVMDQMHVQIVIQGTGDKTLETSFRRYSEQYPGRFAANIGYDEGRAHLVYAGSDCFLMPSRFEPCGLSQMYSMIYGTPPLVRKTGGLADTVDQYHEEFGTGTGFVFDYPTRDALYYTIGWACATYYDRPEEFEKLKLNGMGKDFSWGRSAALYQDIYQWAATMRSTNIGLSSGIY